MYHVGKKVQQRNLSEVKAPIETVIEIQTTGTIGVALIETGVMPVTEIVMIAMLVAEIMIQMIAIATRVATGIMMPATEIVTIVGETDTMETEAMSVIETTTETLDAMLVVTVTATLAATVMEVVTATMAVDVMVVMIVTAGLIGIVVMTVTAVMVGMAKAMVVIVREADAMVAVTILVVFHQHQHEQQPPRHNN